MQAQPSLPPLPISLPPSLLPTSPHSRNLLTQRQDIRQRPHRRDRVLVDLHMALRIVPLDMLELRRLAERGDFPVQRAEPLVDCGVAGADVCDVCFEI